MKTSKCLTAICVVALLAGAIQLRAETEAQAKARQALEQKMRELDTKQPGKAAPALAAPSVPEVAAPAAPAQPAPPAAPAAPPAPAAAAPTVEAGFADAPPPSDTPEIERARAALHQKMTQLDVQWPGAAARVARPQEFSFKSIEPPPSPLSGSKDARLAGLLQRYKSDEISPEDYHKQRAAILAEP